MSGDVVFVDFENSADDADRSSASVKPRVQKSESRDEKLAHLAAQIESGEYEVQTEQLAEILLEELIED